MRKIIFFISVLFAAGMIFFLVKKTTFFSIFFSAPFSATNSASASPMIFPTPLPTSSPLPSPTSFPAPSPASQLDPLTIEAMRAKSYPGSSIVIEKTLTDGSNYHRYLVSYMSDGLKIYGLLTEPAVQKPVNGWPVIVFNHGYIPPQQYSTENSYASMTDPLSAAGYIVFKPDYRGNGNSEGNPAQPYVSADYVTDAMNALESIKNYPDANPNKIGIVAHSMGGNILLHQIVISHDFQAAEFLSGVVGDENQLIDWWNQRESSNSISGNDVATADIVTQLIKDHGNPSPKSAFWAAIDPINYLSFVNMPVEIQVGTGDPLVPYTFSSTFRDRLQRAEKTVIYKEYAGADHNLSPNTAAAIKETITFFNAHVK